VEAAPTTLQSDLRDLIAALYQASPNETVYFLQQILQKSTQPMTSITLRRILPSLPPALQSELRPLLRTPLKGG